MSQTGGLRGLYPVQTGSHVPVMRSYRLWKVPLWERGAGTQSPTLLFLWKHAILELLLKEWQVTPWIQMVPSHELFGPWYCRPLLNSTSRTQNLTG